MADPVVNNVFREAAEASSPAPAAAPAASKGVASWSMASALAAMRMCNMVNGLCLALFAVVIFILPTGSLTPSFSGVTISIYTGFLGLVMCCAEVQIGFANDTMRALCGFMFSFIGRAVFIFFSGSMAMALVDPSGPVAWLYIVGAGTMLNAFFNLYVIAVHPSFRHGAVKAVDDPFGRSPAAEAALQAYLVAHPEIVARAVRGTLQAASQRGAQVVNPFQQGAATSASGITASAYDQPMAVPHFGQPQPFAAAASAAPAYTYEAAAVSLGYNGAAGAAAPPPPPPPRSTPSLQRAASESANPFG